MLSSIAWKRDCFRLKIMPSRRDDQDHRQPTFKAYEVRRGNDIQIGGSRAVSTLEVLLLDHLVSIVSPSRYTDVL